MSLFPEKRSGLFEILEPSGSGAVGKVYPARDKRLGRRVATKIPRQAMDWDLLSDDTVKLGFGTEHLRKSIRGTHTARAAGG